MSDETRYPKSKALQNTYARGRAARRANKFATACPYDSKATTRTGSGRLLPSGERAFARAWMAGWHFEDELIEATQGGDIDHATVEA